MPLRNPLRKSGVLDLKAKAFPRLSWLKNLSYRLSGAPVEQTAKPKRCADPLGSYNYQTRPSKSGVVPPNQLFARVLQGGHGGVELIAAHLPDLQIQDLRASVLFQLHRVLGDESQHERLTPYWQRPSVLVLPLKRLTSI